MLVHKLLFASPARGNPWSRGECRRATDGVLHLARRSGVHWWPPAAEDSEERRKVLSRDQCHCSSLSSGLSIYASTLQSVGVQQVTLGDPRASWRSKRNTSLPR